MIERDGDALKLSGPVDNQTVSALLADLSREIGPNGLILDFAGVERVDSTAVSLLLHLQRQANASNARLTFRSMPDGLKALIHLYDVDHLICNCAP